ncbi:hypothetical protein TD95_004402 [Thielaviopsis punctulata]|uniref:THO complex subunit 2 n=1 Tax=Thielaviopsis punctulata TaxID=72032 RepID=A0A0F4ZKP1_9PEZI|nr:hypothetical protein TD95_004402 [Thielaviopsis punctulata]
MAPHQQHKRKRDGANDSGRPSPHKPNEQHSFVRDRDDNNSRRHRRRNDRRDSHSRTAQSNVQLNTVVSTEKDGLSGSQNVASPASSTPIGSSRPVSASSQIAPPSSTGTVFNFGTANASANAPAFNIAANPMTPASATPAFSAPASKAVTEPVAVESVSFVPLDDSLHYFYIRLTDDVLQAWKNGGAAAVIAPVAERVKSGDYHELTYWSKDIMWSVLSGRLQPIEAGEAIKKIIGPPPSDTLDDIFAFEPHAHFTDTMNSIFESNMTRFRPQFLPFLKATGLRPKMLRELCDTQVLIKLGLIRETFPKLSIRHATNQLYRQTNYNLLREETEGYSKLMTELFTTGNSSPPTGKMARDTFERIKALIGTFDLDVGRVLDVTLDVFASTLIKHFHFYVKLLRCSSWWPRSDKTPDDIFCGGLPKWALPSSEAWTTTEADEAIFAVQRRKRDEKFWERARQVHTDAFFELGGREVVNSNSKSTPHDKAGTAAEVDARRHWIQETKTLPAPGNRTAAQLLGFKLRFYTCDTRSEDDVLPANLLYLAALLIKIGFISLNDLAAHLWPDETGMEKLHEEKLKELEEKELASRPGGGLNALAMAAVLPDDAPTSLSLPSKVREKVAEEAKSPNVEDKDPLPDPSEQKVGLLISLLTIGAIPEALYLIGRYPWVLETHPEILERIHRICHHSISEIYEMARPSPTMHSASDVACPFRDVVADDQGGAPKGFVKLEKCIPRRALRWPFPDTCDTKDNSQYRFYWSEWADNVPVCRSVDDVFTLCDTFLNISNVNIGKDTSLVTKLARIGVWSLNVDSSKSNFARWQELLRRLLVPALSITKANPSITNSVWELLKLYPIKDRYSIYSDWYDGPISRLPAIRAAFSRTRLETLGTMKRLSLDNLNQMAKTLSKTSYSSPGIVFKVALDQIEAYANLIEAFVECAKYFTELAYDVLVWSLLSSLGGGSRSRHQESSVLLTSKWLQALSKFSGKVFRRFSIMNPMPVLQYVNHQLSLGNSTDLIILKELITTMGGIVPSLDFTDEQIVSMCGYETLRRQTLINGQDKRFDSAKSSKRLVQSLVDSQLAGGLLVNIARYRQNAIYNLSDNQLHVKYISSLVDDSHQVLIQYLDFLTYNLPRESFVSLTPSIGVLMKKYKLDASLAFMVGRPGLLFDIPKPDFSPESDGDVDMADVSKALPGSNNVVYETLKPLIFDVETAKEPDFWSCITPEFFTTFWALQMSDVYVPENRYEKEYSRAVSQSRELSKDRSDMTHAGISKRAEKMKAVTDLASQLSAEKKQHKLAFIKIRQGLIERVNCWFGGSVTAPHGASDALIEQCLLPRLLLSPADADFAHRILRFLHDNNAAGFKILSLLDRLFNTNRLRSMIFICTVRESENLGRFLKSVLGDLASWHKDKAAYDSEALGVISGSTDRTLHGFASAFDEDSKPTAWIEHAQFKEHLWGWQKNIYNSLKAAMSSMEWLHIRNGITILKCILDHFPAVDFMARQFANLLNVISEREAGSKGSEGHRVDLSVAAQTALSELQRRKSKWVMVQSFRSNSPQTIEASQDAVKPAIQTSANDPKTENTTDRRVASAKASKTAGPANEAEDGEVRDLPERKATIKQHPLPVFSKKLESVPLPSSLPDRPPRPSAPLRSVPSRGPVPNNNSERFAQALKLQSRDNGRDQRSSRDSRDHTHSSRDDGRDGHDRHREPRDRDSRNTSTLEPGRLERPSTRDLPQLPERRVAGDSSSREKDSSSRRGRERGSQSNRDEASTNSQSSATSQRPLNSEPPINPARAAAILNTQTQDLSSNQQPQQQQQQSSRGRGRRDEPNGDRKAHSPRRDKERSEAESRNADRHSRDKEHRSGRESRNDSSRLERRDKDSDRVDTKEIPSRSENVKDIEQQQDSRSQDRNHSRTSDITQNDSAPPSGPRSRGRTTIRGSAPMNGSLPSVPPSGTGNTGLSANAAAAGQRSDRFQPLVNDMNRSAGVDSAPPTGPSGRRGRGQGHGSNSLPNMSSGSHDRHRQGVATGSINPVMGSPHGVHPDRLAQLIPPPPAGPPPSQRGQTMSASSSDRPSPDAKNSLSGYRNSGAYGATTDLASPVTPTSRTRPGGSQRQLDGINNTLQQAQNDRGRRQPMSNRDVSAIDSGAAASSSDRTDNRDRDRNRAAGSDDHRGNRNDRDRRDKNGDRERGSRRSGRDNSRDRQRERGPRERDQRDRSPEREREKDARDYRERDHGARSGVPATGQTGRESRDSRRGGGRDHGDRHRSDGSRQSGVNHIPISSTGSMSSQGPNLKLPLGPVGGVNAAPIGRGDREKGHSRR